MTRRMTVWVGPNDHREANMSPTMESECGTREGVEAWWTAARRKQLLVVEQEALVPAGLIADWLARSWLSYRPVRASEGGLSGFDASVHGAVIAFAPETLARGPWFAWHSVTTSVPSAGRLLARIAHSPQACQGAAIT